MKTRIIALFAGLLAVLPMTSAWAGGSTTKYWYAQAKAVRGTGCAKVYASASETASPKYTDSSSGSSTTKDGKNKSGGSEITAYLYAQHNYGYRFVNWVKTSLTSTANNGTYSIVGDPTTENGCKVTVKEPKNSPSSDTTQVGTFTAVCEQCTEADAAGTVTFANVEGLGSYKLTQSPIGFPAIVPGTPVKFYSGDQLSFTVSAASGADFVRIDVTSGGETTSYESATVNWLKLTQDTVVTPVFKMQESYTINCLGSEGGSFSANGTSVDGADFGVSNFAEVTVKLSAPVAKDGYEFYGWYLPTKSGGKQYLSYYKEYTYTMRDNAVIGADFRRKADVNLTFAASGCEYTADTAEITDVDVVSLGSAAGSRTVKFAVKGDHDQQPRWWYQAADDEKVYFSYEREPSWTFTESATVGVDFEYGEDSLAKLIAEAVEAGESKVTLAADAKVLDGTVVTIPAGFEVEIPAGTTLFVDGSLSVAGALTGEGTVSTCLKFIRLTGDGMKPCNPYGSEKYWKSSKAVSRSVTVDGWSGATSTHLTVMRGDGVAVCGAITANTKLVECTFGTGAKNHVTAIGAASDAATISKTAQYILLADAAITGPIVDDNGYSRLDNDSTIECAGWGCTLSGVSQVSSKNSTSFLNASTINLQASSYWQNGSAICYNCPSINFTKVKNNVYISCYDSGTTKLAVTFNSDGGKVDCRHYSGVSVYDYSSPGTAAASTSYCYIYGGGFSKAQPDSYYDNAKYAFYQHADGKWYLEEIQDPNVATYNGKKYELLSDALDAFAADAAVSGTITLIRNTKMDAPYEIAAGKNLTLELGACGIDAPNGLFVNRGTLSIRDRNNALSGYAITAGAEKNIVENLSGATLDLCYGVYRGNFANAGTMVVHNASFAGDLSDNGGVFDLRGGVFDREVKVALGKGYITYFSGTDYRVCRSLRPVLDVYGSDFNGWEYELTAMSAADRTLFSDKKNATLAECASVDEWKKVAELNAAYKFAEGSFYIDILADVDREIADGTASVNVGGLRTVTLPQLNPGEKVRIMSPMITQTQISYERFIKDPEGKYDDLTATIYDSAANKGTTFYLIMDLRRWKRYKYPEQGLYCDLEIITQPHVFGAGNSVAMLQPASGAATFYTTLAAALEAKADGDGMTVKLCGDCCENVMVCKSCVIDTNHFRFDGSVTAAEGVALSAATTADDMGEERTVFTAKQKIEVTVGDVSVVVPDAVQESARNAALDEAKAENPGASEEEIAAAAEAKVVEKLEAELQKTDETTGIKVWEKAVLQEAGVDVQDEKSDSGKVVEVKQAEPSGAGETVGRNFVEMKVDVQIVAEDANGVQGVALAKVTTDGDGAKKTGEIVTEGTTGTDGKAVIRTDFAKLPAGVYQPVITVKKGVAVETIVDPKAEPLVVTRTETKPNDAVIIAVPGGQTVGGKDVDIANVIDESSLRPGDKVDFYDTDGKYKSWSWDGTGWTSGKTTRIVDGKPVTESAPSADGFTVPAGSAMWFTRGSASTDPVVVVTKQLEAPKTAVHEGTQETPKWNLVANQNPDRDFEFASIGKDAEGTAAEDVSKDKIIVPNGLGQKTYTFRKGEWGYYKTERDAKGRAKNVWVTNESKVEGGRGFWYVSGGGKPTIDWKKGAVNE